MGQEIIDRTTRSAGEGVSSGFAPGLMFDFDRITSDVLRAFLYQSGLNPHDYTAAEVKQAQPWELDFRLAADGLSALADTDGSGDKLADPLLAFAMQVDQRRIGGVSLEAILPEWLLNVSSLACLLLGRALLRAGRDDEAMAILVRGMLIDPTSGSLRREFGLAIRQKDRSGDAGLHLEAAVELRGGFRTDNSLDPEAAMLVTRPNRHADIYFYKKQFYVVRRNKNAAQPSAKVIDGELFGIQKNAAYHLARLVFRLPLARRLIVGVRRLRAVQNVKTENVRTENVKTAPSNSDAQPPRRIHWGEIVAEWRREILLRVALLTFARRIDLRSETLIGAMELAGGLDAKS